MSTALPADELAPALIAGVQVFDLTDGEEAAVRLLIANGVWLHRPEFRSHVTTDLTPAGALTARADWAAVAAEPDRSSSTAASLAVLRLACHLAGQTPDADWSIARIVAELDATTSVLASRAFAMAALGPDSVGPL